ncbi:DUF3888 domain-containing protein [Paenibacillus sabinae]|uniref:DUF3888 domain-containing protein n=1 Tax=Paenibacillus sabinae T27 TaxID=1268072 RepID=X4ZNK2_9BACL|nr:DUF3888 domain-containing protein [Paenibacillus sabinae]AHV98170.1 hypothetical protein PSAB_16315 [Paenibacillus sabinae T27]
MKIKLRIVLLLLSLILIISPLESKAYSGMHNPKQDSTELQIQDMLMLLLTPAIQDAVSNYYLKYLKEPPLVYPYQIDVIQIERKNGFRGFMFLLTVEVTPVVGPHISVGMDRITFEISAGPTVKLIKYNHIKDFELPPNWKNTLREK